MTSQYTELANGKRHWKQTIYLAEMFDRYHRGERDSHDFFRTVLMGDLGLKKGDYTTWVATCDCLCDFCLSIGDGRVSVCPFPDQYVSEYKWVVKGGAFEEVVEDMEKIFEVIRRAWEFSL